MPSIPSDTVSAVAFSPSRSQTAGPQSPPSDNLPVVLEEAYAATVDPERYESLLDAWESYLGRLNETSDPVQDPTAVYATHFSRALEILDKLGRQRQAIDAEQATVDAISWPALICNSRYQVTASNRGIDIQMPCPLAKFHPDNHFCEQVIQALQEWSAKQGQTRLLPLKTPDGKLQNCIIITELENQESRPTNRRFLIAEASVEFDAATQDMLRAEFELTAAELLTLAYLVQGYAAEQISELRHVTINTTRKQIRGFLEKTGAQSQTDLIRLVVALVAQLGETRLAIDATTTQSADSQDWRRMTLKDGRQLCFLEFGDPNGRPLLFLHHMMGGPMWLPEARRRAAENGWHVIAPSRPGFGHSDALALTGEALVNQTVDDLCALLDYENIEAAVILGSMSSAGLAASFVVNNPNRSLAMLNVGFGGRCDEAMIASLPKRPRIMAQTSLKSDLATRFLVRVGIAAIDILGPRKHLEIHVAHSPPDMQALADPQICETLSEGLTHSVYQGVDAFCKDGYVALTDWRDRLEAASQLVPSACVVGKEDRITPFEQMQRLLDGLGNYQLIPTENAGQLLFYSHGNLVMQHLEVLWEKQVKTTLISRRDSNP